ncbi:phage tail tape measure protein [Enterobacter cloacae complex sp. S4]|uniref:phage tail tape measure protein n=1 Tax=Enterobacteriaceae TaxID=543 RepID=UPI0015FCEA92|nr:MULTISPECIES: phage tail tape measure protein [Enterobacteriaceae]MBA7755469.1 phage tail tape measure protein [Citrobacter sp. RHBSTW-00325]MBE4869885.1 phage tail tape measure protein [Enterobacter cloacae complex sp. S4]MBQ0242659.1 phage tail tape measure protein [Citrobacter freundii]HAM7428132.1 phage tail protein [Escherichia coli]
MTNRLSTEILINLAGNLTAKARQYGANMSEFASRNQKAMSVVKAASESAGRGLDMLSNRYTTMIAGLASGAALRDFAKTDRQLTGLGIAAGKTRDEMRNIFDGIQETAIKFRVDDSEVLAALENVNKTTGDLDFGIQNKDMIAASIAASGSDGEAIGGLFATFQKFQTKNAKENLQAMDIANNLGKEGAFELKDAAEKATRALSMYAAAGGKGVEGIKQGLVVLNSARDATGDRDTAATATENLIRDLQLPKVVDTLKKKAGINVYGNDGKMRSLSVLLSEVAKSSGSKGAQEQNKRLLEAGFNQDSILLISSVTSGKGAENLKRYQSVVGDGTGIMKDAEYAAKDFTSALTSLNVTWKKFSNSNLAGPVQELADAINSVDQKTVQNWLEVGKKIAIATAGVIAARKAFKIGKGAWDFLQPEKGGKGIPKGVSDVFGSGVMPVYVVNMGKGGMGGPGDLIPDGKNPRNPNSPRRPGGLNGMIGLFGLASTIPYLYEEPSLSSDDKAGMVQWAKDRAKRKANEKPVIDPRPWASMTPATPFIPAAENHPTDRSRPETNDHSLFGVIVDFLRGTNAAIENKNALDKSAQPSVPLAPTVKEIQGEIRVILEGNGRVKNVSMNQSDIKLSASAGVSSVGQG